MIVTWDYIAGYFDGEGHAGIYDAGKVWELNFTNTHRASLDAMQQFMQAGTVRLRSRGKDGDGHLKPIYGLFIYRVEELRRVIPELLRRCLVKREVLQLLLDHIQDKPSRHANRGKLGKEAVHRMYWDEGLTLVQIGERVGMDYRSVQMFMRRQGIPRRVKVALGGIDPETIRRLYWTDELTTAEIAGQFSVTRTAIDKFMDAHGILRRNPKERQLGRHQSIP